MMKRILWVLFSGCVSLSAQEPWTLERCISYAMDNNLQIKRQELSTKISKSNYVQSILAVTPDLNGFGRHNISSGKTVNLEDYTYINTTFYDGYGGAQTNVSLFNGFQTVNSISQNKYSLLSSIQNVEKARNDITLNITVGYLQILLDTELLKIAENQYDVSRQQVERTSRLVELGKISRGQLFEIQAQAATDKLNVTIARNNLHMSHLQLAQFLDLQVADSFAIFIPENLEVNESMLLTPVDEIFAYAEVNLPEVRSAEYNLKSMKKALAVARGQRSPNLSLVGILYSRYSELAVDPLDPVSTYSLSSQLNDNFYKQVSIVLNIPIYNNFTAQNRISTARIHMLDAGIQLEQARNALYQQIQQAYADAVASHEKYLSATEAVSSAEEAFSYTQQKYELGSASSMDYNVAKNNLFKSKGELMQAKFEYILRTKILDFYMGKSIVL